MTLLGAQKVFWKMHVTHAASECLQPWSFMIITLSAAWISLTALELCIFILLVVLMARLGF
jgi:hypothetical protein